jgi:oxygen-independent coproporphyrinogen-3 oxidase
MQLYLHIPFCVRKCLYCDFLSCPQSSEVIDKYVDCLCKEIKSQTEIVSKVSTLFIGGGTPSVLSEDQIQKIFATLNAVFSFEEQAEITIEVNPGTVTKEKFEAYKKCGINRISFGLQSTNDDELQLLGRIHTYEEFLNNYRLARECGFDNINIDLMSAIPKQTLASFENSLEKIIALQPEHISAYSLIIEEGTPFAKMYGEGCEKETDLPTEEEERRIYYRTVELLEDAGYQRYEISNYAKSGRECKHNLGYWERKEYLGLGLGASGFVNEMRYRNTDDMSVYMEHASNPNRLKTETEQLTLVSQMEEYMFLGLRKMQGVSISQFANMFGSRMESIYGDQLAKLENEALIRREGDRLMLTEQGIDVSNCVLAEFLQ